MFVKLTKVDGSPIWINASYVVTIEPSRSGSVVVPIGDGLDYDVREKPERVLELLDGAPVPAIVPVPAVDALAPTRPDLADAPKVAETAEAKKPADPAKIEITVSDPPKEESAAKPKRTRKAAAKPRAKKGEAAKEEKAAAEEKPAGLDVFAGTGGEQQAHDNKMSLGEEQVERLRKMAPGSVKKLLNTLVTQFHGVAPETVAAELEANGIIAVDGTRIQWK